MKQKIYNNKLYGCKSKKYLAKFLSYENNKEKLYIQTKELRNVDLYFYSKAKIFYESKLTGEKFNVKPSDYSSKKYREFTDAGRKHKKILKRINLYLSRIETPKYLFSKKDYCYKDNATYHKKNTKFILADIKSFFPSCSFQKVKDFFCSETGLNMIRTVKDKDGDIIRIETDVAEAISKLVTAPTKKGKKVVRTIPQGYPTSTLMSFFAYKKMFDELNNLSNEYGYKFSTYVDDITFSYKDEVIPFNEFITKVSDILTNYGHSLSRNKIKYIDIDAIKSGHTTRHFPIITGIFLKRYKAQATIKLHKKMNRLFNKINSAMVPRNSKEYMTKWENYASLVGVYNTINFIEPKSKKNRENIKKLISLNAKNFKMNISSKRIKQLKWEQKIYSAYCNGTLNEFVKKNKAKLINYK